MSDKSIPHLPAPAVIFEFHRKREHASRPNDEMENMERLEWGAPSGGTVPIPGVGDTVSFDAWERTGPGPTEGRDTVVVRKVVSRHFYLHPDHINVYFVVTDVTAEELSKRLKE